MTSSISPTPRWLRVVALALGMTVLFWLPVEDLSERGVLFFAATICGSKLYGNYQGEMGNRFTVRWLGRRIKPQMGPVFIKPVEGMYDKFNIVLRIEATVNSVFSSSNIARSIISTAPPPCNGLS